jgi:cell division protein FtsQ
VDGAGARLSAQIREAAAVVTGTPLLRVDVDAAEARVAQLPAVASVDVSRGWPGSVVITVAERIPVAVVEHDGRRTLLDAEGVLFDTITGEPPEGVLPIAVPEPGPGDPATATVLAALAALPEEVRDRVALLSATSGEDATLTLLDGTTVVWGSGSQARSKASVLTALLEQLDDGTLEPAGTIDVSTPDAVVLR